MTEIQCEYVADTTHESSHGHTDAEVIEDGVVACTAEAARVIRPAGSSIKLSPGHPRTKRAVCEAHGRYLVGADPEDRPDDYRKWGFDAAEPGVIVTNKP